MRGVSGARVAAFSSDATPSALRPTRRYASARLTCTSGSSGAFTTAASKNLTAASLSPRLKAAKPSANSLAPSGAALASLKSNRNSAPALSCQLVLDGLVAFLGHHHLVFAVGDPALVVAPVLVRLDGELAPAGIVGDVDRRRVEGLAALLVGDGALHDRHLALGERNGGAGSQRRRHDHDGCDPTEYDPMHRTPWDLWLNLVKRPRSGTGRPSASGAGTGPRSGP